MKSSKPKSNVSARNKRQIITRTLNTTNQSQKPARINRPTRQTNATSRNMATQRIRKTEVWNTLAANTTQAATLVWQSTTLPPWFRSYVALFETYTVHAIRIRAIHNAPATAGVTGTIAYEPNPNTVASPPPDENLMAAQYHAKCFSGLTQPEMILDSSVFMNTPSRRFGYQAFLFALYFRCSFSVAASVRFQVDYDISFHTPQLSSMPATIAGSIASLIPSDNIATQFANTGPVTARVAVTLAPFKEAQVFANAGNLLAWSNHMFSLFGHTSTGMEPNLLQNAFETWMWILDRIVTPITILMRGVSTDQYTATLTKGMTFLQYVSAFASVTGKILTSVLVLLTTGATPIMFVQDRTDGIYSSLVAATGEGVHVTPLAPGYPQLPGSSIIPVSSAFLPAANPVLSNITVETTKSHNFEENGLQSETA